MLRRKFFSPITTVFLLSGWLHAAGAPGDHHSVIVGFTRDFTLNYLVGRYDPQTKQWLSNSKAFEPPSALTPFTLFGVRGKLAEVHILFKALPYNPPWGWGADISRWPSNGVTHTLALSGTWPPPPRVFQERPLDDPESMSAVSAFLKTKHLDVPHPRLTQVLRIDLNGDGMDDLMICANTDRADIVETSSVAVYSVVLLRHPVDGKPVYDVLRSAAAIKPAGRTLDDQERLYGATGFYQVLAESDIAGDGREQIAILNDVSTGPEVDLFMLDNSRIQHVLSMTPVYY